MVGSFFSEGVEFMGDGWSLRGGFWGGGWMECRGVLLVVGLLYQRLTIGRCGMGRYLDL